MDHLPRTIGPAPSELKEEEFFHKLNLERQRITRGLSAYDRWKVPSKKPTSRRKPKEPAIPKKLQDALDELGMTMKDFEDFKKEVAEENKLKEERKNATA